MIRFHLTGTSTAPGLSVDFLRLARVFLAAGPKFIMNEYARVLEENGCIPTKSRPSTKQRVKKASLIHFDESFVIAETVVAKQLTGSAAQLSVRTLRGQNLSFLRPERS